MRVPAFLIPALLLMTGGAEAQVSDYETCLNLTTIDPEQARAEAIQWFSETGSYAARHCEASALAEIGANRSAASILQETAQGFEMPAEQRAELLLQAARQWLEAGLISAARGALDTGLVYKKTAALYAERAALKVDDRDIAGAKADLDAAIVLTPGDGTLVALRAAARRRLGDLDGARADAARAVELAPVGASGWLELGKAERALNRNNDARRAWLKAIDVAPGSRAAALARGELQDMDGGG